MKKIIDWIIDQQKETIEDYPELVLPLAENFNVEIACAEKIIDVIVEWETDATPLYSLEELLKKTFPDMAEKYDRV